VCGYKTPQLEKFTVEKKKIRGGASKSVVDTRVGQTQSRKNTNESKGVCAKKNSGNPK